MGERSCGEQANQRAGDPAGFLLASAGSSGRIRLSLSAGCCVYFYLLVVTGLDAVSLSLGVAGDFGC
jgi:hypothetical protein